MESWRPRGAAGSVEILLEGLRRLEYRGYDSAGMALIDNERNLQLHKQQGKVCELEKAQKLRPVLGCTGIAHTRWATHGKPSGVNAHPHISGQRVALVHNGIIENHHAAARRVAGAGLPVRLRHRHRGGRPPVASGTGGGQKACWRPCGPPAGVLEGAYAWPAIDTEHPTRSWRFAGQPAGGGCGYW